MCKSTITPSLSGTVFVNMRSAVNVILFRCQCSIQSKGFTDLEPNLSPCLSSIDPIYVSCLLGLFHCAQCCFSRVPHCEVFTVELVAGPHHVDADPDPAFHLMRIRILLFTLMRIPIPIRLFTLMRIRIRLLIKVMQVCNHWTTDRPRFQGEPQRFFLNSTTPSYSL